MKNEEMARLFSEATPYIQKYHGKTMVVKYGGNAMINEELKNAVMNDLVTLTLLGVRVVLVHGGGPAINEMLKKVGVESHFANGLRVTDDATMEIVQQGIARRRAERRRQRSPPERQRGRQAGPERQGQPADLRPGRQEAAPEQQQALPEPVQPDGRTRQPLFRQKLLRTGLFHELLPSPVRGEGRAAALPNDLSRF